MGFDAIISAVTQVDYQALAAGKTEFKDVIGSTGARAVTLDDEWSALTMLLTGHILCADDPADEVLVGSVPVGDSARLVPPKHVARIAEELARLDDATIAERMADIADALEDHVESNLGSEPTECRERLTALAAQVRSLYGEAARRGDAVIVRSSLFAMSRGVAVNPRPSA